MGSALMLPWADRPPRRGGGWRASSRRRRIPLAEQERAHGQVDRAYLSVDAPRSRQVTLGEGTAVPAAYDLRPVATTAQRARRYAETMTDAKRVIEEDETALDAEDRVWLEEQLDLYRELLTFLREH